MSIKPHASKAKEGQSYTLECTTGVNITEVLVTRLRWTRKVRDKTVSIAEGNNLLDRSYKLKYILTEGMVMVSNLTIISEYNMLIQAKKYIMIMPTEFFMSHFLRCIK